MIVPVIVAEGSSLATSVMVSPPTHGRFGVVIMLLFPLATNKTVVDIAE